MKTHFACPRLLRLATASLAALFLPPCPGGLAMARPGIEEIPGLVSRIADPGTPPRLETLNRLELIGSPAVESLLPLLESDHPLVRQAAARVLGGIKDGQAAGPLVALLGDADRQVRWQVVNALEKIGWPAVPPLLLSLESEDDLVRRETARALGRLADPRAIEPLIAALDDESETVRVAAAFALYQMRGDLRVTRALGQLGARNRARSRPTPDAD